MHTPAAKTIFMYNRYLTTAIKSLRNKKGFTLINIIGLSAGITASLLIILYVVDELSYDKYNQHAGRIYRITQNVRLNDREGSYAGTEKPLQAELKNLSAIEKSTRLIPISSLFISPKKFFVQKGRDAVEEKRVVYAESDLFEVFTLPMIAGTPSHSLTNPNTAVINETTALKYFNRSNVVGETITINDSTTFTITGVIKDIPTQSHFNYDIFLSYASIPERDIEGWGYSGIHNYVLVKSGASIARLEQDIRAIQLSHLPRVITEGNNYLETELKPLLHIHLRSSSQYELEKGGNIQYIYILSAIGLLILLVACINFINLSTARSANRAKEVGVRKALGSPRAWLIRQFLTESIVVAILAASLAVVLIWFLLPYFNQMADKQLQFTAPLLQWFVPALIAIVLLIGCIAGIYPAFYLSSFKPILVLKGKLAAGFKRSYLRSVLVVFQFSVSIFLIIGTLVVYNQLSYIHNKDVGFHKDQMLVIKNTQQLGQTATILKEQLQQMQGVQSVTMSGFVPTGKERLITGLFPSMPIDIKDVVLSQLWSVDENYVNTIGLQLINGRNFSANMGTDETGLIVNEALVKKFGFKEPLNQTIYRNSGHVETFHIVGVVKDFNYTSLRNDVEPLAMVYRPDNGAITARIRHANIPALMGKVEDKWKELSGNRAFTFSFMDQDFEATYRTEQRMQQLMLSFSTLAILIACLGLFGLASYAAEQRAREVAIRKVIGASNLSIIHLLSSDFIKLVGLSILIASPLGWYAMNQWLQDFSYRTDINLFVFVIAGITALLIALATISLQSIKAARANPANSLKAE